MQYRQELPVATVIHLSLQGNFHCLCRMLDPQTTWTIITDGTTHLPLVISFYSEKILFLKDFLPSLEPQQQVYENHQTPHLDLLSPVALNNNTIMFPNDFYGEFTICIRKVNGSLGFTLYSQTDDSTLLRCVTLYFFCCFSFQRKKLQGSNFFLVFVIRHSVKALVKEPAISDGRIRPGDKLVAANGIQCGDLSHEEIIQVGQTETTENMK